jgi:hypothetical protein
MNGYWQSFIGSFYRVALQYRRSLGLHCQASTRLPAMEDQPERNIAKTA